MEMFFIAVFMRSPVQTGMPQRRCMVMVRAGRGMTEGRGETNEEGYDTGYCS